jgi:signal transduction histidine kinase/ActR/RegA family two-component response regulator
VHYALQWWRSRSERAFLVFALLCALCAVHSLIVVARLQSTTISTAQTTMDWALTVGLFMHAVLVQLYAVLAARRDHVVRLVLFAAFAAIAIINLWIPMRGIVLELRPVQLPGGDITLIPIRTAPGAGLIAMCITVFAGQVYCCFATAKLWKDDRSGAVLVGIGILATIAGGVLAVLVDFAHVHAPYAGATPMAVCVIFMAAFLSREYAARATRLVLVNRNYEAAMAQLHAHGERLEELVATRTHELREAKDDAERASSAKSKFLAHMSHEIRTPLGAMMIYAQILEYDPALGEQQRKKLDVIVASGKHLAAMLDNVLELSRIEAGRTELVESPFDLSVMLDEVEQMFIAHCEAKHLVLAIDRSADLPRALLGDGGKLKQVLINLMGNAVKFTERGSIHVSARAAAGDGGAVQLSLVVTDTGIGMTSEDRELVFLPFERRAVSGRAGGTGLGLAISLAYARLMRGDLTVDSTPGAGSSFTFTCSVKHTEAPRDHGTLAPHLPAIIETPCKVLVVDDLAHNRDILVELLVESRFDARAAADGSAALAMHSEWAPDLVLMDLLMEGMDGFETIRRMRSAGSKATIGVVTASAFGDNEREALAVGADFFVRKPYDARELLLRIHTALAERSSQRST